MPLLSNHPIASHKTKMSCNSAYDKQWNVVSVIKDITSVVFQRKNIIVSQ